LDSLWEMDRIRLYQLKRDHPEWTQKKLANLLGRSLSWVKKWLRRFRAAGKITLETFKSQSRAPHSHPREIVQAVRDAILDLRDQLHEKYGRVVGPRTIRYHLHKDKHLQHQGYYLPTSTRTIWKVLKEGGRIPTRVRHHTPLERPAPMTHWEMDFGELSGEIEFMSVVDRGTSILVYNHTQPHYNAITALQAVIELLLLVGCPQRLRFDNDTRFVGSWQTDGYPSALMQFLWCVGVEPDVVDPGKPQHKAYVERSIRTLKYEVLWLERPQDYLQAGEILDAYRPFFNHARMHQGDSCNDRPPYEAFPNLPILPRLPDRVDPDAWVIHYDKRVFRRKVAQNGTVQVGKHTYYVDYRLAKETVGFLLDAKLTVFNVIHRGKIVCQHEVQGLVKHPMDFQDYVRHMLEQARTHTI
jgi:transposase InsO family protein